ncbi:MAG: hypothetical protein ABL857_03900 [Rickettsiales bacterium]|jgi:hypothetical protein
MVITVCPALASKYVRKRADVKKVVVTLQIISNFYITSTSRFDMSVIRMDLLFSTISPAFAWQLDFSPCLHCYLPDSPT